MPEGIETHKLTAPGLDGEIVYSFESGELIGIHVEGNFTPVARRWIFNHAPVNLEDVGRLPIRGKIIETI